MLIKKIDDVGADGFETFISFFLITDEFTSLALLTFLSSSGQEDVVLYLFFFGYQYPKKNKINENK